MSMDSFGFRSFLFEADGRMRRLSRKLATDAATTLPQYAGQSLRHAFVVLYLDERGRPVKIERVEGTVFHFDERGSVQPSLAVGAMKALETSDALKKQKQQGARPGHAVDIKPHVDRKRWEAEHHWSPGPEEIHRIVDAIWPPARNPGGGRKENRTRHRPDGLTVV